MPYFPRQTTSTSTSASNNPAVVIPPTPPAQPNPPVVVPPFISSVASTTTSTSPTVSTTTFSPATTTATAAASSECVSSTLPIQTATVVIQPPKPTKIIPPVVTSNPPTQELPSTPMPTLPQQTARETEAAEVQVKETRASIDPTASSTSTPEMPGASITTDDIPTPTPPIELLRTETTKLSFNLTSLLKAKEKEKSVSKSPKTGSTEKQAKDKGGRSSSQTINDRPAKTKTGTALTDRSATDESRSDVSKPTTEGIVVVNENDKNLSSGSRKSSQSTRPSTSAITPMDTAAPPLSATDTPQEILTIPSVAENADTPAPAPRPSYVPSHWSSEMINFYDRDSSSSRFSLSRVLSGMSDDPNLWRTWESDFPRRKLNRKLRCLNCHQMGHLSHQCKEKKKSLICRLCGNAGHNLNDKIKSKSKYSKWSCPNALCTNCGRKTNTKPLDRCVRCSFRDRDRRSHVKPCRICNLRSHSSEKCPDNWRRYHSTTTSSSPRTDQDEHTSSERPIYKRPRELSCANCGGRGHDVFSCRRTTYTRYERNNPRILMELNVVETETSQASLDDHSNMDISQDQDNTSNPVAHCSYSETRTASATVTSETLPMTEDEGSLRKCKNFPTCQNILLKDDDTCCHEMELNHILHSHILLAQARRDLKFEFLKTQHKTQISVLPEPRLVHIYGGDVLTVKFEIFKLIASLATNCNKQGNLDTLVALREHMGNPVEQEKDKTEEKTDDKNEASESAAGEADNKEEPEIINLCDSEDDEAAEKEPLVDSVLTVGLLESEYELLITESIAAGGVIQKLSKEFKVSISISKELLQVSISGGTGANRKRAKKNVIYFLECDAAGVDYVIQLNEKQSPTQLSDSPPNFTSKKSKNADKNNDNGNGNSNKRKVNDDADTTNSKRQKKKRFDATRVQSNHKSPSPRRNHRSFTNSSNSHSRQPAWSELQRQQQEQRRNAQQPAWSELQRQQEQQRRNGHRSRFEPIYNTDASWTNQNRHGPAPRPVPDFVWDGPGPGGPPQPLMNMNFNVPPPPQIIPPPPDQPFWNPIPSWGATNNGDVDMRRRSGPEPEYVPESFAHDGFGFNQQQQQQQRSSSYPSFQPRSFNRDNDWRWSTRGNSSGPYHSHSRPRDNRRDRDDNRGSGSGRRRRRGPKSPSKLNLLGFYTGNPEDND